MARIGRALSADDSTVLTLISESPAAAAPLMLNFVSGIVSRVGDVPPPPLVDAAMLHYARSADVNLLALLMPGMAAPQALQHSGRLMGLPLDKFKTAVRKLVQRPGGADSVISPQALLLHFHLLDESSLDVRPASVLGLMCCAVALIRSHGCDEPRYLMSFVRAVFLCLNPLDAMIRRGRVWSNEDMRCEPARPAGFQRVWMAGPARPAR